MASFGCARETDNIKLAALAARCVALAVACRTSHRLGDNDENYINDALHRTVNGLTSTEVIDLALACPNRYRSTVSSAMPIGLVHVAMQVVKDAIRADVTEQLRGLGFRVQQ